MKNLTLALLGVLASLWACKKEQAGPAFDNYFQLETGNYWIYDQYSLDTNGVYTLLGKTDSNYVEKDTLIRGETYFKLMEVNAEGPPNTYIPKYLRDSLHYVVDWQGRILFSSENISDTLDARHFVAYYPPAGLADTTAFIFAQMQPGDETVQVPAGTFTTKNYRETYQMWPKYSQSGALRFLDHRYAKEVGLVEETLYFYINDASKRYFVRRLKAYGKN